MYDLRVVFGCLPVIDMCARHGVDQSLGIGMARMVEHFICSTVLNNPPVTHHDHAVGNFGDDAKVVRDEHDAGVVMRIELFEELEDLRLRRHIERCCRLVGDQKFRVERKSHGDHNALTLAARQLVRIGAVEALRLWQPNFIEEGHCAVAALGR